MAPQNHYTQYYVAQAGGGGIGHYYAGSSHQKGHGIGSLLGGLFRTILPLLKSGAAAVGREAARAGGGVLLDLASGTSVRDSVVKRTEDAADSLNEKFKNKVAGSMRGSGAIKRRARGRGAHSVSKRRRGKTSPAAFGYLK